MRYIDCYFELDDSGGDLEIRIHCADPALTMSDVRRTNVPVFLSNDMINPRENGCGLYNLLFDGDWERYSQHLREFVQTRDDLGVRLCITANGGCVEYPWEWLCSTADTQPIGCSPRVMLLRAPNRVDVFPTEFLSSSGESLRALIAIAGNTDVTHEIEVICHNLVPQPDTIVIASADEMLRELIKRKPHLVHLFVAESFTGHLSELVAAIGSSESTLSDQTLLRVVIVHLCKSAILVQEVLPIVTYPLHADARNSSATVVFSSHPGGSPALTFTRSLYTALSAGYSLAWSVGLARYGLTRKHATSVREWSMPMLTQTGDIHVYAEPLRRVTALPPDLTVVETIKHNTTLERDRLQNLLDTLDSPGRPDAVLTTRFNQRSLMRRHALAPLLTMSCDHSFLDWLNTTRRIARPAAEVCEKIYQLVQDEDWVVARKMCSDALASCEALLGQIALLYERVLIVQPRPMQVDEARPMRQDALRSDEAARLQQVLSTAYNSQSLDLMLWHKLEKRLRDLSPEAAFPVEVANVIDDANRNGWVRELLRATREQRPEDKLLERFELDYLAARVLMVTDPQRKELITVLEKAFTAHEPYEVLWVTCEQDLLSITHDERPRVMAYDVIEHAKKRGWLPKLVWAANQLAPGNSVISSLAAKCY